MTWLSIFLIAIGFYVASTATSLLRNYLRARKTGFPIYLCPIDPTSTLSLILFGGVSLPVVEAIPKFLWRRLRFFFFHASFLDQFKPFDPPEPALMLVTPGQNLLWVHEPGIGDLILARRKDFLAHELTRMGFGIYGPNLITSDGDEWLRYRKLFSKGINDKIARRTWQETVRQSREMVEYFLRPDKSRTDEMISGVSRLAINVQLAVQYDIYIPWEQAEAIQPPSLVQQVARDLKAMIPMYTISLTFPKWFLTLPFWPKSVQQAGIAASILPQHLKGLIDAERKTLSNPGETRNTFLGNMLHFLDSEKAIAEDGEQHRSLSDKELVANLFLFTLASFDTTANTISYAIALLAIHPEWQDWIIDEIDAVSNGQTSLGVEDFSKLPRCLAIMYETLRLFPAVNQHARSVSSPQTLHHHTSTYHVPASTQVWIANARMHWDPTVWGPNHLAFAPARFTSPTGGPEAEQRQRRYFLPWSRGPRQCPGMKIAQIEFVALMATVFSRARVECARMEGEGVEGARARTLRVVRDSVPMISNQVRKPKEVVLIWKERRV